MLNTQLEAIVLKRFDYQEHHKIVKMLSPSHGLISVFAGYASKRKYRYAAILEPLTIVSLDVKMPTVNQRQGDFYYLNYGDIIKNFHEIKCDYELIMLFYEMVKIIISGDINKEHFPQVYQNLKAVLEAYTADANCDDELKFRFLVVAFKAKMLASMGILPATDGCVSCQTKKMIVTASVIEGGLICANCYQASGIWLATDSISLWRALFKLPIKRLVALAISESQVCILEAWMKSYYEAYSNIKFAKRL